MCVFVLLQIYKSTAFKHVHKGGVNKVSAEPKHNDLCLAVSDPDYLKVADNGPLILPQLCCTLYTVRDAAQAYITFLALPLLPPSAD